MHSDGQGETVASPFKRHRASQSGPNNSNIFGVLGSNTNDAFLPPTANSTPRTEEEQPVAVSTPDVKLDSKAVDDDDEEL